MYIYIYMCVFIRILYYVFESYISLAALLSASGPRLPG